MNPCPCGYYGDSAKNCLCTPYQIKRFYKKLSGPIVDRIDMVINVPRIKTVQLRSNSQSERSEVIRKRVSSAWLIQNKRGLNNCDIQLGHIDKIILLTLEAKNFMALVNKKMNLSPRAYLSIIRIAQTIADLNGSDKIQKHYVAEAVQYKKSFEY